MCSKVIARERAFRGTGAAGPGPARPLPGVSPPPGGCWNTWNMFPLIVPILIFILPFLRMRCNW